MVVCSLFLSCLLPFQVTGFHFLMFITGTNDMCHGKRFLKYYDSIFLESEYRELLFILYKQCMATTSLPCCGYG